MIPKILHYCWFGGKPLSAETEKYIATWRAMCPDYEIKRWDETTFDVNMCPYAKEAYEAKKWAFLADYARLWALHTYGGVYMDTDVELIKPLDGFLGESAFCGFEEQGRLCTALMGSEPGGKWVGALLESYRDRHFLLADGSFDQTTNVTVISDRTEKLFGLKLDGTAQRAEGVLTLWPRDRFSPMDFETGKIERTENTVAIHHFVASWHDEKWLKERAVRYKCIKLFGEGLGNRVANAVNFARRRDGSFRRGVIYYLTLPLIGMSRLLPVGNAVVFETEGDFCDNGRALYEYLLRVGANRRRKLIWLVKEPDKFRDRQKDNVLFLRRDSLAGRYWMSRAQFFFFTHPWWMKSWRRGQTVVSLWHGVPLKAGDGRDLSGLFDFFTASSPETYELYRKFTGVKLSQYLPLGQPRLDVMFQKRDLSPLLGGMARGRDYDKLILCMPTFRQTQRWTDGTFANTYSINPVETLDELEELNAFLAAHRMVLAAKIHHLQKLDFLARTSLSHILYLTDDDLMAGNTQLYELVGGADCLLTDYSSIYFDYLTLDRPIGFFVGDMAQYTRGFLVEDPLAWMPGEKIRDFAGLLAFLEDVSAGRDDYGPARKALRDKVDPYQDDENCKRIAENFGL